MPFLILDANERVGDSWRKRWDSLKLFTPARFNGLDGMPWPGPAWREVTKDEMGDYLESYVQRFALPVETGVRVQGLSRDGSYYRIDAGDRQYEAEHVVVAMASYQEPKVPSFTRELRAATSCRCIPASTGTWPNCAMAPCCWSAPATRARRSPRRR